MKKIGIVGGVAWPSTVLYYSALCRKSEQWHCARNAQGTPTVPEISIESLDHVKAVAYLGSDKDEQSWARFDEYHRTALKRLAASGAEFAIIASNTPHHRFDAITKDIPIPVISILEASARECARVRARKVLLLGSAVAMKSPKFHEAFAKRGVEATGPEKDSVRAMTIELMGDLQLGKTNGAAERLMEIARLGLDREQDKAAVCLACTELPLAFEAMKTAASFSYDGIVFVNSAMAHIEAAFNFAVGA